MFIITRADGKFWDGYGWNVKGKIFCTIGGATRSLHEEGESSESATVLLDDGTSLGNLLSLEDDPT